MDSENAGARYLGLLVDYDGVLTTSLFDSFRSFCDQEGIAPDEIGRRFREDRECRQLLIGLETGKLAEEEFEPRLAEVLGVAPQALIDRMFAGAVPDEPMVQAVRRAHEAGIRTGL